MLADREGRLEDRPKRIKGELLPFDSQDAEPLLQELAQHGFIIRYQIDGASYIQISKFSTHQTPHYSEKHSAIKPPTLQEIPCHQEAPNPDNSEKVGVIKRGSQPPDSLIPDSLNPEIPPLPPDGGKPSPAKAVQFKTFLSDCKASGENAIADYRPVFAYAEQLGIPLEFVQLAWFEFGRQFGEGGVSESKRQKDWRRTFRNYVEKGYLRLWWTTPDGKHELTTLGRQAQLANAERLAA